MVLYSFEGSGLVGLVGLAGLGLLLIKGPPTRIRLPGLHMIGYLLREDWTRDLV